MALAWASEVQADAEIVSPDMADGDVLLFDGRLWHGSLNEGERTRRALLLQYAAAGQDVRIPTDQGFDWPFAFTDKLAPVIRVLSTATAGEQAFGTPAPFPPETALAEPFASRIVPAPNGHPWKAHHLFRGQTAHVDRLAAHFTHLKPGHSPHPPHAHLEEETLIVVEGEAEILVCQEKNDPEPDIHVLGAGDFAYYPAYQWHTIRNASTEPVTYLMFKWRGVTLGLDQHVGLGVFHDPGDPLEPVERPLRRQRVFEGPTHFLRKLHVHRSRVEPAAGYEPHRDAHDVLIVLLSGALDTLGKIQTAPAVLHHPAGTPHGLRAAGDTPARYLVIEMHGSSLREEPPGFV